MCFQTSKSGWKLLFLTIEKVGEKKVGKVGKVGRGERVHP